MAMKSTERARAVRWYGIALLVLGVLSLFLPSLTALAVEVFVAWFLVVSGAMGLVTAWYMRRHGLLRMAVIPFVMLAIGLIFLVRPDIGVRTLAIAIACAFLIQGAVTLAAGLLLRRHLGTGGIALASGAVSILLGLAAFAGWPSNAGWLIGIVVGVNLLCSGTALVAVSGALSRIADASRPTIEHEPRT